MPKKPKRNKSPNPEELDDLPSKSARKREMHALQELGESLVELNEKQLQQVNLQDEALVIAIAECHQITSNSARKRHLQFIGKLMRDIDPEPIERAIRAIHHKHETKNSAFHDIETLRDAMLLAGVSGVELAIERFPELDRQHVRQLLLQHQREQAKQKPPAASRKLFRYLKELQTD